MISEPLMRATVEAIVFVGTCDDDVVDPDVAVAQLELLAFILKELNASEKEEFAQFLHTLTLEETAVSGRTARTEFLSTLVEDLGIN